MAKPNKNRRTGSNNRVANLSTPASSAGTRRGAAAGTRTAKPKPTTGTVEKGGNTNTDPQSSHFYDGGTRDNPNRLLKTSHPAYARIRQKQIDAERERLRGVGNPPAKPNPPAPPAPQFRSPAIGAPVHARPQAFGAAAVQPSAFAPQVGQAPRPNTPQPSAAPQPQAPANPFQAIGNIQGQAIPEGGAGLQQQPMQAGTQEYGGQHLQGVGADGVDRERRRAFLDADDSLSGLKAVKDLLNRRKLSISVEN
jgi:hypothetical protein